MSERQGGPEIPTLPFCHSGMRLSDLPQPLTNLTAVQANEMAGLLFAYRSLRAALGGSGKFRTNFDTLAENIKIFETKYTLLDHLTEFFALIGADKAGTIKLCLDNLHHEVVDFGQVQLTQSNFDRLKVLESGNLKGVIFVGYAGSSAVVVSGARDVSGSSGPNAHVKCMAEKVRRFQK